MSQDEVNQMVMQPNTSIRSMRESGATADQLYAASEWLSRQPGYQGQLVKSTSEADRMLGPSHPVARNTVIRETANMCQIAAGDLQVMQRRNA